MAMKDVHKTTIIINASKYVWMDKYALWAKDVSIEIFSQAMNEILNMELKPICEGLCWWCQWT